jgi:hypothetical protein
MKQILTTDDDRHQALENAKTIIMSACRRGLEATCEIAEQLNLIDEESLYLDAGYTSMQQYAQRELMLHRHTVARILGVAETIELLREAQLQLPDNETQLAELIILPPEERPQAWEAILGSKEYKDQPVTSKTVRNAVKVFKARRPRLTQPAKNGDKIEVAPFKISEEAEEALERIRRICGTEIADKIVNQEIAISERALIKWADQENYLMAKIAYYMMNEGCTLAEALRKEDEYVNDKTTIGDLLVMARFSETPGHYEVEFSNAVIRVDLFEPQS